MLFRQTGAGEAYCNGSSSERDKTMNNYKWNILP